LILKKKIDLKFEVRNENKNIATMSKCSYCKTLVNVVKKQTESDEAVSNGKITDGKYLEICRTTKKLYENLLKLCECKDDEDDEDSEDDEILVDMVVVTHDHTRDLVGLPGEAFVNNYLGKEVYVEESYVGNKRKVWIDLENGTRFKDIYYDDNDGMFKEEINWTDFYGQ